MQKAVFVLVVLGGMLLSGCAVDPRNVADAEAIKLKASEDSLDRQAARIQAADSHALALQEAEGIQAARVGALRLFYQAAGLAGSLVVLGLAAGLALCSVGIGRGVARSALLRSDLVPLAKSTRQFPLVVQYSGRGRFSLVNPNTGAVLMLDSRRSEDRQLIAASGAVQLAGVISAEAARSNDAPGVAMVRPVVVGAKTPRLEVEAL
jgi:hypothetical protein